MSFGLILEKQGKLKKEFNEVSLADYSKDNTYKFDVRRLMLLKKNPLLCSAYYTWIISATNPATIHDWHRHIYNEIVANIKANKGDFNVSSMSDLESQVRVNETQLLEKHDVISGRKLTVTRSWLLKSRRKRLDEIKKGVILLADEQTVTTALLFCCMHGRNVVIQTSDRDLVDIKDNLYKSIIERYAVNEYLSEILNGINKDKVIINDSNEIELTLQEINHLVKKTLYRINDEKEFLTLAVLLYKVDKNKVFTYSMKIPIWLRDFILEYKKNVDCISLQSECESLYNLKYTMHPDFYNQIVKYKIQLRTSWPFKMCLPVCGQFCKYPRIERDNPYGLTEFI